MQSGQSNGRNNGVGRTHHSHNGHTHHPGVKSRDLKLSHINSQPTQENSMMRSEEKERQRQEARALREIRRGTPAAPHHSEEPLFSVVQRSPRNSDQDRRIANVLGDFSVVSQRYQNKHPSEILMPVDRLTPPTTPSVAHLHDPDIYTAPPSSYSHRKPPDYNKPYTHRPHGGRSGGAGPPPKLPGPLHKASHHHTKFVEDVKPSLKSGPGPGPGNHRPPPHPHERSSGGPGRDRPRSHDKVVKDPQVQRIMNEMSDLKSPLSAISQTPRPDHHQSAFHFPTTNGPSNAGGASRGPAAPPSEFRLPQEPLQKSGKSSEARPSSSLIPKALNPSLSDDFQLSEESDEEVAGGSRGVPEAREAVNGQRSGGSSSGSRPTHHHSHHSRHNHHLPAAIGDAAEGLKEPPVSPLKNTDDSSEESSCTDSESSSSEEEHKESKDPESLHPTTSPASPSSNPWSLESIFQQSTNPKDDESVVSECGVRNNDFSERTQEIKPEPMPSSPHTVDEPAPPVVTTMPNSCLPKSSSGSSKPLYNPTTDESSDDDMQVPPKGHHRTSGSRGGSRTSSRAASRVSSRSAYSRSKVHRPSPTKTKKLVEPDLSSSDSEGGVAPVPPPSSRPPPKSQMVSKSPKALPLPISKPRSSPLSKVPKKREAKKGPITPTHSELKRGAVMDPAPLSEGDSDVNGYPDSHPANHLKGASPRKVNGAPGALKPPAPSPSPSRLSGWKPPGSEPVLASSQQKSPRKVPPMTSPSAGVTAADGSHHRHLYKEARARSVSNEREGALSGKESKRVSRELAHPLASQPSAAGIQQEAPLHKKEASRASEEKRKRRKSRRESESDGRERRSDRVSNWDDPVTNDVHPRLEEPSGGGGSVVASSPMSRRAPSSSGSSSVSSNKVSLPHVQYENGVPKLLCSIPLNLIDKLPNNSSKRYLKEDRINKEVLEMRTSSGLGGKKEGSGSTNKSPPNEDETKLRAIRSIYKKKENSLEPEKIKREVKSEPVVDALGSQSPALSIKTEDAKPDSASTRGRPEGRASSSKLGVGEEGLKRHGSSSSLSSMGTGTSSVGSHSHSSHSKKHKKETRKEKEEEALGRKEKKDKVKEKALEVEASSKRKKRMVSPEPEVPPKRTRGPDNSAEPPKPCRTPKAPAAAVSSDPKKQQQQAVLGATPHEERPRQPSPSESSRDARVSPHPSPHLPPPPPSHVQAHPHPHPHPSPHHLHPQSHQHSPHTNPLLHPHSRPSPRNASEEPYASSLSHEGHPPPPPPHPHPPPPYVSRMKPPTQPQQQHVSSQENPVDEHHHHPSSTSGSNLCEDQPLPMDHGSATYRNDERVSPAISLGEPPHRHHLDPVTCGQMYPSHINPSLGTSMEYTNPLMINQDPSYSTPVYMSYFERKPHEPVTQDNALVLSKGKQLKHQADNESCSVVKTMLYLEAVLYFIMTGECHEYDRSEAAITMYSDTVTLIRFVSSPVPTNQRSMEGENRLSTILKILSLRCQSLLSQKVYSLKLHELRKTRQNLNNYKASIAGRQPAHSCTPSVTLSSSSAGEGTSGSSWVASQRAAANNSPSSLSSTPSPADSVGSEGSQSSGYSTEGARQRNQQLPMGATPPQVTPPQVTPMVSIPSDIYSLLLQESNLTSHLTSAFDDWDVADDYVRQFDLKDFFIELDRKLGPLTHHSSLWELVHYVYSALEKLKRLL